MAKRIIVENRHFGCLSGCLIVVVAFILIAVLVSVLSVIGAVLACVGLWFLIRYIWRSLVNERPDSGFVKWGLKQAPITRKILGAVASVLVIVLLAAAFGSSSSSNSTSQSTSSSSGTEATATTQSDGTDSSTSDSSSESQEGGVTGVTPTDPKAGQPAELSDFEYTISDGKAVLGDYKGDSTVVEIPASFNVDGVDYVTDLTDDGAGMFMGSSAKAVILDEGITEVANAIFNSSDIEDVYFPSTMTAVYDRTMTYLHPDDGKTIGVYYGGTQDQWNSIFSVYHEDNSEPESAEEAGAAFADKLNKKIGAYDYDASLYTFYFSKSPSDVWALFQ